MLRITGIVIDTVKHTDRHNVVTLYTREQGRISFVTPAGGGKKGARRSALFMPLSIISADIRQDATRELQFMSSPARHTIHSHIYSHPVKSAISIFIAEFLNHFLRHAEADPPLWDYIANSISILDRAQRGIANQHLAFLIGLLPYSGIFPDLSDAIAHPERDFWLDMREGITTQFHPLHRDNIEPDMVRALPSLLKMRPRNCYIYPLNGALRRTILDNLLRYYSIHFPGIQNLKSPAVLKELIF